MFDFLKSFYNQKIELSNLKNSKKLQNSKIGRVVKFSFYFFLIFLIFVVTFSFRIISSSHSLLEDFVKFPKIGNFLDIWAPFKGFPFNHKKTLKGETESRINFLLLGIGGSGHEGAYLADLIILVSFNPFSKEIASLSLPRDLYVPIPKYGWRRINNAYALGELNSGQGGELISQTVSNILNLPIHYWVSLDFEGFKNLIDKLGGIRIYIERSFIDYQYPAPFHKYQTVSFKQGWENMNGERALKFVRSRYGTNGEGSDFARSQRQQKVLLAIKDKIFSFPTLIYPERIIEISRTLGKSLKTNLLSWEIIRLVKLGKGVKEEKVVRKVLEPEPGGPLRPGKSPDGAYILMVKNDDFKEINYIAQNIFQLPEIEKEKIFIEKETPRLIIENGTQQKGLAANVAQLLKSSGFRVLRVDNALRQDFEKTVIYDLTQGQKSHSLIYLKKKLKANVVPALFEFFNISESSQGDVFSQVLRDPLWNFNVPLPLESKNKYFLENKYLGADFLIILGKDNAVIPREWSTVN